MSIVYFWRLLTRYYLVMFAGIALGLGLAGWYVEVRSAYETRSVLLVSPPESVAARFSSQPERFILTQVQIASSDPVLRRAASTLSDSDSKGLASSVVVDGGAVNDTITISAEGATALQSQRRVAAVSEAYRKVSSEPRIDILRTEPSEPSVSRARAFVGGGVAGGVLGAATILAIGLLRRPVLSTESLVEEPYGVEVFPYTLTTSARNPGEFEPQVKLLEWLVPSPWGSSPVRVMLRGVLSPVEADALAASLRKVAEGRGYSVDLTGTSATASNEGEGNQAESSASAESRVEGMTPDRSSCASPSPNGPALELAVWASSGEPTSTVPDVLVHVVRKGCPQYRLEQAIRSAPFEQPGRLVVID